MDTEGSRVGEDVGSRKGGVKFLAMGTVSSA